MIDLSESRTAVLVKGKVAMIFDTETPHLVRAFLDIRNWIKIQVVHDIARVIADLNSFVCDLANDFCARDTCSCVAPVLFQNHDYSVVAGDRPQCFEALDPEGTVAPFRVAERQ